MNFHLELQLTYKSAKGCVFKNHLRFFKISIKISRSRVPFVPQDKLCHFS